MRNNSVAKRNRSLRCRYGKAASPARAARPRIWYEGSGTATRRYFYADLRGSMTNVTSQAGAPVYSTNSYEEYGRMSGAVSFFGFTGEETYNFATNFKTRFYSAPLGRFLSPDPTGYEAGMNLYGYVDADPINLIDPWGLSGVHIHHWTAKCEPSYPCVTGQRGVAALAPAGAFAVQNNPARENPPAARGDQGLSDRAKQERNCHTNPHAKRALADPDVQQNEAEAMADAMGWAGGNGFAEFGFWSAETKSGGVIAYGPGTDRLTDEIYPDNQRPYAVSRMYQRYVHGAQPENVFHHTHTGEVLSKEDKQYADQTHTTVVADNPDGTHYCYPG
ncbi:MAG: hypothetical protein QOE79_860 [Sphingomonadales bacterium]|jgi:RHS repeat-associated protein|nr:hypothetical protein [Sphingomonadales bacterium]